MKTKLTCIALNSAPHRFPWYWTIHIDTCLNWIKNQSIFLWFTSLDSRNSIKHVEYYYLLSYYCLLDIGIRIWKIYKIVVDKWHSCYNHYAYKQTMSAYFFIMFWRKQFIIISLGNLEYCTTCIVIHLFCILLTLRTTVIDI